MLKFLADLNYIFEVLLAELVFLHAFPRRRYFPVRYGAAVVLSMAAGYLQTGQRFGSSMLAFATMLLVLALTVGGMYFAFQGKFLPILSACLAGVALQHIGYHASKLFSLLPGVGTWNFGMEFVFCMVLDGIFFLLLLGPLYEAGREKNYDPRTTIVSLLIVLMCTGMTRFLRLSDIQNVYGVLYTSMYAVICCLLALYIQFSLYYFVKFRSEYLLQRRIREEERQQYEMSREKNELINIKCHDLKHKLLALEPRLPKAEVDSMREIIDSYDGTYHTGLDVLDTILNEKSLRCRSWGIALTYMGPGEELGFLEDMDLYSMFGNILENAITAADQFTEPDKRAISMTIERRGNFVLLNTVNYLKQPLHFLDGLPQTTKGEEKGYHGYGLKSVREIARRYHGDLSISTAGGIFRLSVYFMNE